MSGTPEKNKDEARRKPSPPTTRSTAGPGFDFEDQVGAWILQKMLAGEPLPDMGSLPGLRLQTQVQALKWHIDDLLVTCGAPPDERHIAISCKSNVQVTGNALPRDFAAKAWAQWDQVEGPMRRGYDRLMMVTRGLYPAFQGPWTELKTFSHGADPAFALARIAENPKLRDIYQSVVNARDGSLGTPDGEMALQLIQHLHVVPTDFQFSPSEFEASAIAACRKLLTSAAATDAQEFWKELKDAVKKARLGDGTILLSSMWASLRQNFALTDHPDFVGSWTALRALTKEHTEAIDVALPNGTTLARTEACAALAKALTENAIIILRGDSGVGKSALLKHTLESSFPTMVQVWLGPEEADAASNELRRASLQLAQSLLPTLQSTTAPTNILVLDSAERLSADAARRLAPVLKALAAASTNGAPLSWRVVVVTQTDGSDSGLGALLRGMPAEPIDVEGLSSDEVKEALRTSDLLRWIASEPDMVAALSNLRALAWVMEAEGQFQPSNRLSLLSPNGIADRLWDFWTEGKIPLQRFLMRLAVRDADFEHSVPISELDAGDLVALEERQTRLPVRKNARNRIEFQHDLASEWARFQQLKEIAHKPKAWAIYVTNPLWTGALRMLGQLLLREPISDRNGWDMAFESLEAAEDVPKHATDVLLDALFLDPFADTYLSARLEFLLADHGAHLNRLLRRFSHVATVASPNPDLGQINSSLRLYTQAMQRSPVFARWPGVLKFLAAHRQRIAALVSTAVADVCLMWLTTTPAKKRNGEPFYYRAEVADLALAAARELQVLQGNSRVILADESEPHIYRAAFAAAADRPDEVSSWALEMAGRVRRRKDVADRIAAIKREQAEEHKRRMESDPEYKAWNESARDAPFLDTSTPLPPWPLGPKYRVDRHLRETCAHPHTLQPLMHVRPEIASEVLLAAAIEDSPREEYGSSLRLSEHFGLANIHATYPTAHWQGAFFPFLQINPDVALNSLISLANFCTSRWEHAATRFLDGGEPVRATLTMSDGARRSFTGGSAVLGWGHESSNSIGILCCGLAALEQWLCLCHDKGVDIDPYAERILRDSNSVALLGALLNVGKRYPLLFESTLLVLLTSDDLYFWDETRTENLKFGFDQFAWVRKGEFAFNLARDWWFADYRSASLREIAKDTVARNAKSARAILEASKAWPIPADRKASLEVRLLQAEVDPANHRSRSDPKTGTTKTIVEFPAELMREVNEYHQSTRPGMLALTLPNECEKLLRGNVVLPPDQLELLGALLNDADALGKDEDLAMQREVARMAAACTLLVTGGEWLRANADVKNNAEEILASIFVDAEGANFDDCENLISRGRELLRFAAYVVVHDLLEEPGKPENNARVMTLITSAGLAAFMVVAYGRRTQLGGTWQQLLRLGTLWAALRALKPGFGKTDDDEARWRRHLGSFRSLSWRNLPKAPQLDLVRLAERTARMARRRVARRLPQNDDHAEFVERGPRSVGLDPWVLEGLFAWLFINEPALGPDEAAHRCALLQNLLSFEIWQHPIEKDEDREPLPYKLGYSVLGAMAWMTANVTGSAAAAMWQSVLKLDFWYHHFIGHYLRIFFGTVARDAKPASVIAVWKPMLECGLTHTDWTDGRHWFHGESLLRSLLGFGSEAFLNTVPAYQDAVANIAVLYEQWAKEHLKGDDENVSALCAFLTSSTGLHLRMPGLLWIRGSIEHSDQWRLHDGAGDALITFINAVLDHHVAEIAEDAELREAVLAITAKLVAHQIPAALALQEHARSVLRRGVP